MSTKPTTTNDKLPPVGCILAAAALGLASLILPVFILSKKARVHAPLFPLVRSAVEGMSVLSLVFLFVSGFIMGIICPRRPFLVGVCTMAAFPVLAIAEMLTDGKSHNLFPLEFLMYGAVSLIAVVGAYIGSLIKRRMLKQA